VISFVPTLDVTDEQEKRCAYDERVREVERVCFSPLVFSASGGMGPSATTVCISWLPRWQTNGF